MFGNRKILALVILALATTTAPALAASKDTYATLHAGEPAIPDGFGRIYFYRESSIMGGLVQPEIRINGEDSGGDSRSGDYFYVDRPAGTYEITTTTEKKEAATVTLVAGQAVYVKTTVSMGLFVGHVLPSVVDNATAQAQIVDCDYRAPKPMAPTAPAMTPAPATPPSQTPPSQTTAPATTTP